MVNHPVKPLPHCSLPPGAPDSYQCFVYCRGGSLMIQHGCQPLCFQLTNSHRCELQVSAHFSELRGLNCRNISIVLCKEEVLVEVCV